MPRDRLGSWQELDPWLEVAAGREGKPAPRSPEKGRACRQRGTGLLGGDPGRHLPESAPESPVCRAFSMPVLVIGLFTSSVSSCSGDCTFLRTNPLLPARLFYWPIAACSRLS